MKTIDIVIPAYNEQDRLKRAFTALYNLPGLTGVKVKSLIFVNDGSRDKTYRLIKQEIPDLNRVNGFVTKIISYPVNYGKGYAVKSGLFASSADFVLLADADMSTPLTELKNFIPFLNKGYDVISGTRRNKHAKISKNQPYYRQILGRGFTGLANSILNTNFSDFTCGFKLLSQKAKKILAPKLTVNRWSYDAEILYLAVLHNLKIKEISVAWINDKRSKVKLWRDIPQSLIDLFRIKKNSVDINNSIRS